MSEISVPVSAFCGKFGVSMPWVITRCEAPTRLATSRVAAIESLLMSWVAALGAGMPLIIATAVSESRKISFR